MPENTWEYKITNNNNQYIFKRRKFLIKFRFTDKEFILKSGLSNLLFLSLAFLRIRWSCPSLVSVGMFI